MLGVPNVEQRSASNGFLHRYSRAKLFTISVLGPAGLSLIPESAFFSPEAVFPHPLLVIGC